MKIKILTARRMFLMGRIESVMVPLEQMSVGLQSRTDQKTDLCLVEGIS